MSVRTILRRAAVKARTGLSVSSIIRYEANGIFPQRVKLSEKCVGYYEDEINAWIADRVRGFGRGRVHKHVAAE